MKEDAKAEAKEHGIDKDSTEHGHITVTHLKMVSDSCSPDSLRVAELAFS